MVEKRYTTKPEANQRLNIGSNPSYPELDQNEGTLKTEIGKPRVVFNESSLVPALTLGNRAQMQTTEDRRIPRSCVCDRVSSEPASGKASVHGYMWADLVLWPVLTSG
ncbi:unnamed protein product [Sphagnum jensenii]|jgi:hypothetical protein